MIKIGTIGGYTYGFSPYLLQGYGEKKEGELGVLIAYVDDPSNRDPIRRGLYLHEARKEVWEIAERHNHWRKLFNG